MFSPFLVRFGLKLDLYCRWLEDILLSWISIPSKLYPVSKAIAHRFSYQHLFVPLKLPKMLVQGFYQPA